MPSNGFKALPEGAITQWLQRWHDGDSGALEQLTNAVYKELRRIAGASFRGESRDGTLQPTALVHELYLQLPEVQHLDWQNRAQFLNVAARIMRNVLVDHARKRRAAKRGGDAVRVEMFPAGEDHALQIDVLMIHEALDRFEVHYPQQARVVELRFFGGLTSQETAEVLGHLGVQSSLRGVERDWAFARAWLQ